MKRKTSPRALRGPGCLLICCFALAALIAALWFLRTTCSVSPHFRSLSLAVNGEYRRVDAGATITLHPSDVVQILSVCTKFSLDSEERSFVAPELSSGIVFLLGMRLRADDLDINAFRYGPQPVGDLLPDKEILAHYSFRVHVLHRTTYVGHVELQVRPFVEDWVDKADRTIDRERRVAVLEKALALLPEEERLRERLLNEYKELKKWQKAALMLEEDVAHSPSVSKLEELIQVYSAMENNARVISTLERLVDQTPDDSVPRERLADKLAEKGRWRDAAVQYKALLKLTHRRNALPVLDRLGYVSTKSGDYKAAISYYLKAVELEKKDANLFYNLSYLYEKTGAPTQAAKYLSKAVELKADDVESRLKLAEQFLDSGDLRRAEEYLKEVLKKKPTHVQALVLMAKVYEKRKDKRKLKEVYKRILALEPRNHVIIYNLGVLEYETGNLKASAPYLEKYVKRHAKDVAAREILFAAYKGLKEESLAYEQAKALVELKPAQAGLYHYIFDHLHSRGDWKGIIEIMGKGVLSIPTNGSLREYLVLAYLETGDEAKAEEHMSELLELRPKDVGLMLQLSRLKEERGDSDGALTIYGRILEIAPDNEEAADAYLRLRLKGVQHGGDR